MLYSTWTLIICHCDNIWSYTESHLIEWDLVSQIPNDVNFIILLTGSSTYPIFLGLSQF